MTSISELERQLIAAKGDPERHARLRQRIREAGFPHLAGELDRIASTEPGTDPILT